MVAAAPLMIVVLAVTDYSTLAHSVYECRRPGDAANDLRRFQSSLLSSYERMNWRYDLRQNYRSNLHEIAA